jgi:hypothetical protein
MKNREVRWWLLGFCELCDKPLDKKRLFTIKNHLNLAKAIEGNLDEPNALIYERLEPLLADNAPVDAIIRFQKQLHTSLINLLCTQVR